MSTARLRIAVVLREGAGHGLRLCSRPPQFSHSALCDIGFGSACGSQEGAPEWRAGNRIVCVNGFLEIPEWPMVTFNKKKGRCLTQGAAKTLHSQQKSSWKYIQSVQRICRAESEDEVDRVSVV